LSRKAASKLQDAELGAPRLLHSHSFDAAREGFYAACKVARESRKRGLDARYPYRRKRFRPTVWKRSAIRRKGKVLLLSLARSNPNGPIRVRLPAHLRGLSLEAFREVKLVYNRSGYYEWHIAVEDGREPEMEPPGDGVAAVDPGEIHPLALTDGKETLIVTARELRAIKHWRNKKLAEIQHKQAAKVKGSRAWWRLQQSKNRLLARTQRQMRDIEHKVSRAGAEWVRQVAYGDVRDVADGKRLHRVSQQKVSQWAHGRIRNYFSYKVAAYGVEVVLQDEAYTSRTCPNPECSHEHKPRGRNYVCPVCGLRAHRDAVGAANILSLHLHAEMGHIQPTN
jgi:putative transposase